MKNKVPPPILLLLFGAAMWFVAKSEFAYPVSIPYALIIAIVIAVIGVSIAVLALRRFSAAETTVNPLKPDTATSLVQSGIFSKSRNPMYVGLVMDLVAWSVWLQSLGNIVLLLVFIVVLNEWQIKPEEAAMRKLFGDEYADYCKKVRRWL
ncbi:MAG: methyltransferase family protein [Woeseiaceae bacterium]